MIAVVREQHHNCVSSMRPLIEGIKNTTELLVSPPNAGKVSVYCLFPTAVFAHPVVRRNLRVAHRHLTGRLGNIVPVIVINAR